MSEMEEDEEKVDSGTKRSIVEVTESGTNTRSSAEARIEKGEIQKISRQEKSRSIL